jgi:hypothetical protein
MKIETELEFSVEKCRENPDKLYIFGDNCQHIGLGGTAVIRNEYNTYGISTKYDIIHSYSDDRILENKMNILQEIQTIKALSGKFYSVVLPKYGIGTGLAQLQLRAPKTFIFLCTILLEEFNFNNMAFLQSPGMPINNK